MAKSNFEIGQEVAYDMNCYCDDCIDLPDQGYVLHIIDGTEDVEYLNKCCIFSEETMNRLR